MAVLQALISPWKKEGEKREKKTNYYYTGDSNLVTHPSSNPAEQGLTSLSGERCSLQYSDSTQNAFVWKGIKKRKNLWNWLRESRAKIREIWKWVLLLPLVIGHAVLSSVSRTKITLSQEPITLSMFSTVLHLLLYSLTIAFWTVSYQCQWAFT